MSESKSTHHGPKEEQPLAPAPPDDASDIETKGSKLPTDTPVSDVLLAPSVTGGAPSLPKAPSGSGGKPATPFPPASRPDVRPAALKPGARIDDFEVVKLFGRGAFGHVYLARQTSLDRLVALKVSANRGSEGRTMARLEHQHIVQVFSETVDRPSNQRLLCMQLVPGIGLEKLIAALYPRSDEENEEKENSPANWTGRDLLAIIDRSTSTPPALDPSALKEREALEQMDAVEAVAWFGSRLAEALDFAHCNGVLHRDIKPANILIDSYGRPMLADFNISSHRSDQPHEEIFGGTFAYMAPEHLRAFNPQDETKIEAVAARSDIYSLGLVLHQMLTGKMAFAMTDRRQPLATTLQKLTEQRLAPRPACQVGRPRARKTLERTINCCLAPEPEDRFSRGSDLAEQLDGCRRLRRIERQLPPLPKYMASALRHPIIWLIALHMLPQLVASFVNYLYNFTDVVHVEDSEYHGLYVKIAVIYNSIIYVMAISLIVISVRPVLKCWMALASSEQVSGERVAIARQKALRLPIWFAAITSCAWYIGGLLIPPIIYIIFRDPKSHLLDFMLAHCVCGLIALAYSTCGELFIVLRVLYPAMWQDVRNFTSTARVELAPMSIWLNVAQFLAGAIPLAAAAYILIKGDTAERAFQWLTVGLIGLGLAGFYTAITTMRRLSQAIEIMTKRTGKTQNRESTQTNF